MKKQFALALVALAGIIALNACGGGGWSDTAKDLTRTGCDIMVSDYSAEDGKAICDCYVNKLVEKYPDGQIAENDATIDECKTGFKTKAEMEAEQQAAMPQDTTHMMMDTTAAH